MLFGFVSESFHGNPSSVVVALVPLAHKMVTRTQYAIHQKSAPLIFAQEKTQSDVPEPGKPRPGIG